MKTLGKALAAALVRVLLLTALMSMTLPALGAQNVAPTLRRLGLGVRGGVALDPALVVVGIHATLGPVFTDAFEFRPDLEYEFGETTKLLDVNLEGLYYFQSSSPQQRLYVGAGPGFDFFFGTGQENEISLNVLGGIEWTDGKFVEIRGAAYGGPSLRITVGYNF